jgi:thiamine-phosphate pyrophosphorylase
MGSKYFLTAARAVRDETAKANAIFIVNDRVDVALLANADGVHLGQEDLPVKEARRLLGAGKLIGLSTHTLEEALAAKESYRSGYVDYIS